MTPTVLICKRCIILKGLINKSSPQTLHFHRLQYYSVPKENKKHFRDPVKPIAQFLREYCINTHPPFQTSVSHLSLHGK